MGTLYENILFLCNEKGIKGGKMCTDLGISKSLMTDLKAGRKRSINAETAKKISDYFGVSVSAVIEGSQKETPLVNNDEELTEYLEELKNRPEKRMLFSVTKTATKAQIEAIVKMIEEMQGD